MHIKKNKFLLKLGILFSSFCLTISCLVVSTYAYVSVEPEGDYGPVFIYGENGLNTTYTSTTYGVDTPLYDTGLIEFNYDSNLNNHSWKVQLWRDVNSTHSFVRELAVGSSTMDNMNTYNIFPNLSNFTLTDLMNDYRDYYIRFALNNSPTNFYLEYSLNVVYDYFNEFILSSNTYNFFYLVFQVTNNSVITTTFENVGIYFGESYPSLKFEYNGKFFNNFDQTMINTESYNQGVQSQQSIINDLRNQNSALNSRVNSLTTELQNAQNTQMRSLLWTIAGTPFESFKTIWDVNVWGLNIGGIILGGLMALFVVYLIKKIWK